MTCYEHLRKKTKEDGETFSRLNSYFHALENDKLEQYHDLQDKRKQKRLNNL